MRGTKNRRVVAVVGSSLVNRTIKRKGVPTKIHEREVRFTLDCGHEVVRRYQINRPTTEVGYKLHCCECAEARGGEAA